MPKPISPPSILLVFLTFIAQAVAAQDATAPLEPRTHYMGRVIAQTMSYHGAPWLTRPERRQEERPDVVMRNLGIKPDMTVCDLGCGNGYYTLRLAREVGETGKVLAVDIQPEMIELLRERAGKAKLNNIEPILSTTTDPKLPEGTVDLLMMVDVYHEFSNPDVMLAHIRKSLAPGGRVALLEFRAEDPNVPIKPLHKMSKDQILKEYQANGFQLVGSFDELPWQHLMFFSRDDAPTTNATPNP